MLMVEEREDRLCASLGMQVELELLPETGDPERLTVDIVPDGAADFSRGFLGAGTPLARAITGRPPGTVVAYRMADIEKVRVLAVSPSVRAASAETANKRQAAADAAVAKSQHEDAVRLALTVDVKWGDYDPEGLEQDTE